MNEDLASTWIDESDEEIACIRGVRHHISEQFGHDQYRLVVYNMDLQKERPEKPMPAPDSEAVGKG